jgi:hypothetical protein
MAQPRFAFWWLLGAAVWVAATGLRGGFLASLVGLPLALGLVLAATSASRGDERAPRRVAGAGVGALLFALAHLLVGGGLAGVTSLVLALGAIAAGTRLSLEHEPVARELPPRSERSPSLAFALAADETLRLYWDFTGRLSPRGSPGFVAERLRAAAARNRERGLLTDPALAHPLPPGLEKPELDRVALRGLGDVETLRFESEYEPIDPELRDAWLAVRPNRTAHAWLWRHAGGGRPALIAIHGYSGGRPALDARGLDLVRLHRELGLDVALFALPLHGPRAAGRRSGEGFFDGDPLAPNAALGQAVWDLRRLAGWLRAEGAPVVGAYGGSLGGATTALFASLDGRLACAIPHVPAADLAALVWDSLSPQRRAELEAEGVSRALFDEAWAPVAPLRHRPKVAPEGRLIIAGAADRLCTPAAIRALHERWDRCELHWFRGSHLWPLGRGGVRQRLDAHLRLTLLAPPPAHVEPTDAPADVEPSEAPAPSGPPPLSRFRRT